MAQAVLRGIARRAVQAGLLAAGILIVLVLFSHQQAHADTTPSSSPSSAAGASGPASALQTAGSVASAVTQGERPRPTP